MSDKNLGTTLQEQINMLLRACNNMHDQIMQLQDRILQMELKSMVKEQSEKND